MRRATPPVLSAASLMVALLLAGCDKARIVLHVEATGCTGCHGGADDTTGAPPRDLAGQADPHLITVGAHTAHLAAGVRCEECHRVPSRLSDPGHIVAIDGRPDPDRHAEVDLARGRGSLRSAQPAWTPSADRVTGTCAGVYCHGATLGAGGAATTPTWNEGPLPGPACGACHASPPPSHGPIAFTTCVTCHPRTVTGTGTLVAGGAHLNGDVDVDYANACTACHGDAARSEVVSVNTAAPPVDLGGRTGSDAVGAHQAHLHDGTLAKAFACAECHLVPTGMTHAAGGQQRVQFATAAGTIARTDGATPGWSAADLRCSGVYCHGATLGGGSASSPTWTAGPAAVGAGGATAAERCGTCHGFPPPAPHPQQGVAGPFASSGECATCHPGTVDAGSGAIRVSQGLHVDGTVEVDRHHQAGFADPATHGPVALVDLNLCRGCHGATLDGALGPSCTACHTAAGHPSWKTECTFCHGNVNRASLGGFPQAGQPPVEADRAAPPFGTQRETTSSQVAVGAHLAHLDPGGLSRSIGCLECHGPTLPSDETHADATVAVGWGAVAGAGSVSPTPAAFDAAWKQSPTCTNYCHGASLGGGTHVSPSWIGGSTEAACGACHAMRPGAWHPANTSCGQCHPATGGGLFDPSVHVNGHVDLTSTLSCTSCHGTAGVNEAPPVATDGSTTGVKVGAHQPHLGPTRFISSGVIGCDACHPAPSGLQHATGTVQLAWSALATAAGTASPSAGPLPAGWEAAPTCTNYCHGATLPGGSASKAVTWTDGPAAAACGSCHFLANPPSPHPAIDFSGTPITVATQCRQCHPDTVLADGTIDLVGGKHVNGRVDGGGHPTGYWDPALHGPVALGDIASCTACHGADYAGNGIAARSCNACHANPAAYGHPGYAGSPSWKTDCTFCHGSAGRAADSSFPLVGTPARYSNQAGPPLAPGGASSGVGVGAHLAHFDATTNHLSSPIDCAQCHGSPLPSDLSHLTGSVAIGWGARATAAGAVTPTPSPGVIPPGWESSPTCTNYCHGATLLGGALKNPAWTAGAAGSNCAACHGDPMPYAALSGGRGFHPPNPGCGACHPGYSATAVAGTTHVDGTVDAITLSCHSCHGDVTSDAPDPGPDTTGGATAARIGAHRAHTTGKTYRAGFGGNASCGECHGFAPSSVRHANGRTEIGWVGVVATAGTPTINGSAANPLYITPGAAATCTNYCHGATLPGGAHTAVTWSETGLACDACHFIASPPAPHPGVDTLGAAITSAAQCHLCHPDTAKADGTIDVAGGKHVNGQLDGGGHATGYSAPAVHGPDALASITSCQACHGSSYDGNGVFAMDCTGCHANPAAHGLSGYAGSSHWQTDCTFCHGSAERSADSSFPLVGGAPQVRENLAGPPLGSNRAGTGVKVGAHLAHFDRATNTSSGPISCSECHGPTPPSDLAHVNGTVAMGWGELATGHATVVPTPANITPAWEAAPTCTNYCHGATLVDDLGATAAPPVWTGGAMGCAGCHGNPPVSGQHDLHVYQMGWWCADCHTGTVDYAGKVGASHLNGARDVQYFLPGSTWDGASCTSSCHDDGGIRSWR